MLSLREHKFTGISVPSTVFRCVQISLPNSFPSSFALCDFLYRTIVRIRYTLSRNVARMMNAAVVHATEKLRTLIKLDLTHSRSKMETYAYSQSIASILLQFTLFKQMIANCLSSSHFARFTWMIVFFLQTFLLPIHPDSNPSNIE